MRVGVHASAPRASAGPPRPRRRVTASAAESAGHSACQAPAARSCSCSPPVSRPAFACTSRAHARASTAAAGLRLCGIELDDAAAGLANLADLGLREQDDVEADLPARARGGVERAGRARPPASRFVCHGSDRLGEPELARRTRAASGRGRRARQRPGRAAELRREASPRPSRRRASTQGDEPARRLQPERGRHRLLEQRPRDHRRRAVGLARARRTPPRRRRAPPATSSARPPATSIAAVSRMSWLVAPGAVRVRRRARAVRGRAARPGSRPPARGSSRQRSRMSATRLRGARDVLAPAPQRALGVEHRREPRLVRDRLAGSAGTKSALERRQCAKKTVASPCIRISNRRAPSPSSATSVARSVLGEAEARGRHRSPPRPGSRPASAVAEQAAREDEDDQPRRLAGHASGFVDEEREAAVGVGAAPAPALAGGVPAPRSSRPRCPRPAPSKSVPCRRTAPGSPGRRARSAAAATEPDRVVRADRLRGRLHERPSIGVAGPPRTTSHR